MPYFDRFDICEAYAALEGDWNVGGLLRERPSCLRRNRGYGESVGVQLHRLRYSDPLLRGYDALTENGKAIYDAFVARYLTPKG